jgi:tRNA modification GTPase
VGSNVAQRALDQPDQPDQPEQLGIARTREALADADLVLLVHDATQPLTDDEQQLANDLAHRPHLILRNKIDLLPHATQQAAQQAQQAHQAEDTIATSALTGQGIDTLRAAILHALQAEGALADAGALNSLRQREAVTAALAALDAAAKANAEALPHELILVDLHNALRALDSLTGQTTTDDILGRIFSTFCIGK